MIVTPKGKHLGRIPDRRDPRDYFLKQPTHLNYLTPPGVNLRTGLTLPVFDQGSLGSCTANAGAWYRLWLALKFPTFSQQAPSFSRLWLYFQERKLEGAISDDNGAQSRSIFQVLTKLGVPPESDDPYDTGKFADPTVNDNAKALADAANYKIGAYHRIIDGPTLRSCLAVGVPSGFPVSIGFTVYESFENIGPDGKMPVPGQNENVIGGHETVVYGYEDGTDVYVVENSWGESWGLSGTFLMPYSVLHKQLANGDCDALMGHLGKPW